MKKEKGETRTGESMKSLGDTARKAQGSKFEVIETARAVDPERACDLVGEEG